MRTTKTFLNIRKDRHFLLKVYSLEALCFSLLCGLLYHLRPSLTDFGLAHLLLLPFGVVFGLLVASFIHNTSHGNVGNMFVNRMIGEFCGAWVLYGFTNFIMIHFLHHKYSDTEYDPVSPKGMSFLVFLFAPMRYMIRITMKWLNHTHGQNADYQTIMLGQVFLFHLNLVLKLVFWFLLLGPAGFCVIYLPSIFTNYAVHAHINFVCHQEHSDGEVEILNLNHNVYYRLANFFTIGGYFHKNHHLNLKLFNPMKLESHRQ